VETATKGLQQPSRVKAWRSNWTLALGLLLTAAVGWFGWSWWSTRQYRALMAEVDAAVSAGRFGVAARDLANILTWKPNSDEAAYVLGMCEQARGRNDAADAAWARVRPGSTFAERAFLARLRLLHDTGRLAAAETLILDAADDPRNDRSEQLVRLVPIYSLIGRSDEAERLLEARWQRLVEMGSVTPDQSIKLVRPHIELTLKAATLDQLRASLDEMGRLATDDDRVWLGRANLAIRTGQLEEAKKWLDACERKRPDDIPVWKAWLNWGIAAKQVDVVERALRHLPDTATTAAEQHRVNAWLCSQRNDLAGERKELEAWVVAKPDDLRAIERLVALANPDEAPKRIQELELAKSKIEETWASYRKLYERTQHMRDAAEMARLAEQLGRWFEARVFLTLALVNEPKRQDLRKELETIAREHGS
jgi:tetratricopeptide (TPR) repeat protein